MKVPAVLLSLALATSVAAQGSPTLPPCAQKCADQYLKGGIGNCGSDPKCICENSSFIDSIACCLVGVCDSPAQTSAIVFAVSLCSAFGVTTLPTTVSCSTAKPTGAQTSTKTSATTTAGGNSPSAGASNSGSSSGAATPTPTGSANGGSSPQSSSSQSTNFGPRPTAAAGLGAIGGIVAAMALL